MSAPIPLFAAQKGGNPPENSIGTPRLVQSSPQALDVTNRLALWFWFGRRNLLDVLLDARRFGGGLGHGWARSLVNLGLGLDLGSLPKCGRS